MFFMQALLNYDRRRASHLRSYIAWGIAHDDT